MEKHKAIVVDLDGTLADVEHRVHHVRQTPKNWNAFHQAMDQDESYFWCIELIAAMRTRGYKIYFVTGRDEDYRNKTEVWLQKHNVQHDGLYMRTANDFRQDSDVKEELYHTMIEPIARVLFVVDDRKSVVERWRKMGLVCLQCAPGDF